MTGQRARNPKSGVPIRYAVRWRRAFNQVRVLVRGGYSGVAPPENQCRESVVVRFGYPPPNSRIGRLPWG